MTSWLNAHTQALLHALARMRRTPLATALSILVIAIAIVLPLTLYGLFSSVSAAAARLNTDPSINIYMALAASDADAAELRRKLTAHALAAEVKFTPREAALADMKRRANLADLLAGLESNPLPHAFSLKPKTSDATALETLRRELAALPKVDAVTMDYEWARKLTRFARLAERIVLLVGVLLATAVVVIVGNTIRLQMLTQKDEIAVARLIGATRRFVRRPFLYFGALQGAVAGILALGAVTLIGTWAGAEVAGLGIAFAQELAPQTPGLMVWASVLAVGAGLGWLGAFLSVGMYWRQIEAEN